MRGTKWFKKNNNVGKWLKVLSEKKNQKSKTNRESKCEKAALRKTRGRGAKNVSVNISISKFKCMNRKLS